MAKDGTVFVSSLAGNYIWRIRNKTKTVFHQYTAISPVEGSGPTGLALDPQYETNGYVYSFVSGETNPSNSRIECSVYRFTNSPENNSAGTDKQLIIRLVANPCGFESGGRIAFGPDGKLYISVGTMIAASQQPEYVDPSFNGKAQNWGAQVGKILRINKDGTFPSNNPKPKGVWAKGVRNSFGFTWDRLSPKPYRMWEAEAGPDCNDEINLVTRGANLGWGGVFDCTSGKPPKNTNQNGDRVTMPKALLQINPQLSDRPPTPTGIQVCEHCQIAKFRGRLFVATFQPGLIYTWQIGGANNKRNTLKDKQLSYFHGPPITALEKDGQGVLHFCDATGSLYKLIAKE